MTSTDRIEKRVLLRASPARVWRALTDSQEFGTWFAVKIDGPFAEGATVRGQITHPGKEVVRLIGVTRPALGTQPLQLPLDLGHDLGVEQLA